MKYGFLRRSLSGLQACEAVGRHLYGLTEEEIKIVEGKG